MPTRMRAVLLVLAGCRLAAADLASSTTVNAKPRIVLIEYNPWAMVIGSDTPTFALYDDGTVIFRAADNQNQIVKLTRSERDALLKDLGISELTRLNEQYQESSATDQPTNRVCVWTPNRKCVAVYGRLRPRKRPFPDTPPNPAPAIFRRSFERMIGYSHPAATRWTPPQLELMIQPFNADTKVEWPSKWGSAQVRKHGGTDEVFLDGRFEGELRSLLEPHRGQGWVFVIDGRTWALSGVRAPFPAEAEWMR